MLFIFGMSTWYSFIIQQMDHINTTIESAIYLSLIRTIWPIGLALMVLICVRGYGGPLNTFLSSASWLPLCRLSYAIYIVHMPVLIVLTASSRRSIYFSTQTMVCIYFIWMLLISQLDLCISSSIAHKILRHSGTNDCGMYICNTHVWIANLKNRKVHFRWWPKIRRKNRITSEHKCYITTRFITKSLGIIHWIVDVIIIISYRLLYMIFFC